MTNIQTDALRERFSQVTEQVAQAARRGGRTPDQVEIVVAGKYIPAEHTQTLIDAGIRVVGENRLQDLQAKHDAAAGELIFDFIGHLQRRKVRSVLPLVRAIHSLDSLELAMEIDRRAKGPTHVLCQVNLAAEPTKGGILPTVIHKFVDDVSSFENIVLTGLMALPPATIDPQQSRPHFAQLREINQSLAQRWSGRHTFQELSMGTSQDFLVAAEEGATRVRIGQILMNPSR